MDANARQAEQARGGGLHELSELIVEACTVGVDVEHSAAEGRHGQLRGVHDGVTSGVRTQPGGRRGERSHGETTEAFPQLIRAAEAEMTELVQTPRAGLTAGTVSDKQHPDRFHAPSAVLATAVARPLNAARAASTASMLSDLPWRRRA